MKEVAITAASIAGLLGFAAFYGNNASMHRARRDIILEDDNIFDEEGFDTIFTDMENLTSTTWDQMQADLGVAAQNRIPFEMEDDVGTKANLNRFRTKDVIKLHDQMVEAHEYRMGQLLTQFVDDSNIRMARSDPKGAGHDEHLGFHDTHPTVQRFLDEFNYQESGINLFRNGKVQFWFLFPAAVPLFTERSGHLGKYRNYWDFTLNFKNALPANPQRGSMKLSIGLWARGAVFSPRGANYNRAFPWGRVQRYYLRPRMTTARPYLIPTADSLLQWVGRFGASTPSAGQDCYVMWFHQDIAQDAGNLLIPDQYQKIQELNKACTVLHFAMGVSPYNEASRRYFAQLLPGMQTHLAKDADMTGVFFAEKMEDLNRGGMLRAVFKYITLVENRAGCRCVEDGWAPEPTEPSITLLAPTDGPTGESGVEATDPPAYEGDVGTEPPVIDATGKMFADEGTGAPTMRGILDDAPGSGPKVPEIDSCCGHDPFNGTPYDSELRTCCASGQARPWNADGMDPCMTFGF